MLRDMEGRGRHGGPPAGRPWAWRGPHRTDARPPPPRYPRVPRARPITEIVRLVTAPAATPSTPSHGQGRSADADVATPILVRQLRNGIEESVHRGDIVEADASGELIRVLGDPERVVTLRSTVKPFGAVALIEAGGVEAFDLQPAEIAILASSHSGEDIHVRTLQGMFRRAGVSQAVPRVRCRGDAARCADRRTAGTRRREGRPDPPHVLGPARGLAAALAAQGLGSDRLLEAEPPVAGRLSGRRRPRLRDDADQLVDGDRRLRRRDVRLPAARGGARVSRCSPTPTRSRPTTRASASQPP